RALIVAIAVLAIAGAGWWWSENRPPAAWSAEEVSVLQSLWLESLPELPPDPSNAVAENPLAVEFGRALFFDTRFSANGSISCATCHQPERHFTDGLPKGVAIGMSKRNTPSIVGTAYSPWLYWDGRRDSQWSQALSPLEDPDEHASNRLIIIAIVVEDKNYWRMYESVFGEAASVDTMYSNIGKAIAAFERTIMPTTSRFDEYVAAVVAGDTERQAGLFSEDEIRGLRLFIGEANCTQCHNGPLLTNNEFHNTGLINFPGEAPDKGRIAGVREVLEHAFNCRGPHNDDPERNCNELDFARTGPELIGAFRTPSLRNLENTAPYGHKGQLATLADVLAHYNAAPDAMIGHNESKPLDLNARELAQIETFLRTLAAPSTFAPEN
ncbi:MAG: cytochrome c peroxidase, partial [Woeseiaceae bacterium]